jgi:mannose-6-phosphate isomerase-like protein (cupin superfamily)
VVCQKNTKNISRSGQKGNGVLKIRRVVTAHSEDGKAIVASDTEVEGIRAALLPGFLLHQLWGSDASPTYPDDGSPLDCPTWFPPVGGFRFFHFILPPDTGKPPELENEEAAVAEMEAKLPGLLGTMEPDNPGMHTSDTVDVLYVVSGRAILELDDGVEVELRAGDTAVQSGTRHRWHNRGSEPAHIVGALIGARRVG